MSEKLQFPVSGVILPKFRVHLHHYLYRKDERGKHANLQAIREHWTYRDLQIASSLKGCTELAVTDSRQEVVLYFGVWEEGSQCMDVKTRALRKVTRGLGPDRFF